MKNFLLISSVLGAALAANAALASTEALKVGDYYGGGVVFHVYEEHGRQHGLIAAINDVAECNEMGCVWDITENCSASPVSCVKTGAVAGTPDYAGGQGELATGINNLPQTVEAFSDVSCKNQEQTLTGLQCAPAAHYASKYEVEASCLRCSDWYLPSATELHLMFEQKDIINETAVAHGGERFRTSFYPYWSSTENIDSGEVSAWYQYFSADVFIFGGKYEGAHVRAIRSF